MAGGGKLRLIAQMMRINENAILSSFLCLDAWASPFRWRSGLFGYSKLAENHLRHTESSEPDFQRDFGVIDSLRKRAKRAV